MQTFRHLTMPRMEATEKSTGKATTRSFVDDVGFRNECRVKVMLVGIHLGKFMPRQMGIHTGIGSLRRYRK
jgi:hypothetical protein